MHAKSGGSSGEPPDFLFIPAACRSRKDLPRSAGGGGRARNTGNRPRDAEDGATGTGAGCGARGAGRRTQNAERRTQNAEHGLLAAGSRTRETGARSAEDGRRGHGVQDAEHGLLAAGSRTRETRARGAGDGAQAPVHGTQRDRIRPARPRNNRPGPFTAGRHPPPGPIRRDLSRLDARRRDPQQPAGAIHSRAPSATGTCNNPPGPFTAGRHPPRAAATCRAYESESRRCRRARRTCCCRAAPRPT